MKIKNKLKVSPKVKKSKTKTGQLAPVGPTKNTK